MSSKNRDARGHRTGLQLSSNRDKLGIFVDISCVVVSLVNFTLKKWIYPRNPLGSAYWSIKLGIHHLKLKVWGEEG